jgi:hypothetical protein
MLWAGLARMALLNAGHDVRYVEFVLDELEADRDDRGRCDFYTGLFAFVFLSEQGLSFNGKNEALDEERIEFLRRAVEAWLR